MSMTALVPDAVVAGSTLVLLVAGQVPVRAGRWRLTRGWLGLAALALAIAALGLELWLGAAVTTLFDGGWQQDRFSLFAKAALLLGLAVLLASSLNAGEEVEPSGFELPLTFLVVLAGMVAASATSLTGLWVGLEVAALAAVAAAGLAARQMGVRLLVVSAVAGTLVAVGFAMLAAFAGASSLTALRAALGADSVTVSLAIAILIAMAGVAVRLGLAPFQWATVEGALGASPVGAAALGGLLAGVAAIVATKLLAGLSAAMVAWAAWLAILAACAMLLGGLRAAVATSSRTLIAWLVVVQVGWVAAGLAAHDRRGAAAALFLLGALVIAAAAAPALAPGSEDEHHLAGLGRAQPARAVALALLLLSLTGAPPLAGYFGQFTVAAELLRSQLAWVMAAGLLGSLLSLVGVLRVLGVMYLESGPEAGRPRRRGALAAWRPGPLLPGVLILAYGLLANPVHGLAVQAAAALRLP